MDFSFFNSEIFSLYLLPGLIFLARIVDVSLQTLRIIFISRSLKLIAAIIGFFEVLIWLTAITQIMKNLHNPLGYIAYALGFSAGTYLGIKIENRLSLGKIIVSLFLNRDQSSETLINRLKDAGFGLTTVNARGTKKNLLLVYSIVERSRLPALEEILGSVENDLFYTVEDLRHTQGGYFYPEQKSLLKRGFSFFQKK